jgi:hypothetical protein
VSFRLLNEVFRRIPYIAAAKGTNRGGRLGHGDNIDRLA